MNASPERCCDLVMKGGITSGVIYPKVVEQVAEKFHLVGIAGTSAGAIAASLAAAAEYRRRSTGSFAGFEELAALSQELAEPGRLLGLFTPDRATRKLFKTLRKIAENGMGLASYLRIAKLFFFRRERRLAGVRDNYFGLATGMANGNRGHGVEPLSEWLADRLDQIAGREGAPLTFRDLHEAPAPAAQAKLEGETVERAIDFRAVTTCLTLGRPFELPFTTKTFAFDPDEMRRLFPERVVEHMVAASRAWLAEQKEKGRESSLDRDGKLPLMVDDLPVVVAVRMSLSFPLLLSMVPLWAVDYRAEGQPLQRVWFSDGGITSNFPIHRFDSIYPLWPTLGLTLAGTGAAGEPDHPGLRDPDVPEEMRLIYLPQRPQDGVLDHWNRFDGAASAAGALLGFGGAIFGSAQNWHDTAFLKMPGYRDRVAEVLTLPEEGGLNLAMPPERIRALARRGELAGRALADRFANPGEGEEMTWDSHRWTRFRSGMTGLMAALRNLHTSVRAEPMAGGLRVESWLDGSATPEVHAYRTKKRRTADEAAFGELMACLDRLFADGAEPFSKGPRPPLEFGSRASM